MIRSLSFSHSDSVKKHIPWTERCLTISKAWNHGCHRLPEQWDGREGNIHWKFSPHARQLCHLKCALVTSRISITWMQNPSLHPDLLNPQDPQVIWMLIKFWEVLLYWLYPKWFFRGPLEHWTLSAFALRKWVSYNSCHQTFWSCTTINIFWHKWLISEYSLQIRYVY